MELSATEQEAIHGTLHRLEQRWQGAPLIDPDWHTYDRLPFWNFIEGLRRARELTDGRRLVDLGCGIGTNLAVAYGLGWDVMGVDKRPEYIAAARELLPEASFFVGDIMEMTEIDADVIYMYRPARPDDLEQRLENHVLSLVKSAVCFWPLRHSPDVWIV